MSSFAFYIERGRSVLSSEKSVAGERSLVSQQTGKSIARDDLGKVNKDSNRSGVRSLGLRRSFASAGLGSVLCLSDGLGAAFPWEGH